MRRFALALALLAPPAWAEPCEKLYEASGASYVECGVEKIRAAKAAGATTSPQTGVRAAKPGYLQTPEEFAANMAAENAANDAERATARAKADEIAAAEKKRLTAEIAAKKAKDDAEFKSSGTKGNWLAKVSENRMDNTSRLVIVVASSERLPGTVGKSLPMMVIRCEGGETEIYLDAGTVLATTDIANDVHEFRAKYDKASPEILRGFMATSHDSVFFPFAPLHIRKMRQARELIVEVTPYRYAPATAKFNVTGLDQHLPAMRKHCKL